MSYPGYRTGSYTSNRLVCASAKALEGSGNHPKRGTKKRVWGVKGASLSLWIFEMSYKSVEEETSIVYVINLKYAVEV